MAQVPRRIGLSYNPLLPKRYGRNIEVVDHVPAEELRGFNLGQLLKFFKLAIAERVHRIADDRVDTLAGITLRAPAKDVIDNWNESKRGIFRSRCPLSGHSFPFSARREWRLPDACEDALRFRRRPTSLRPGRFCGIRDARGIPAAIERFLMFAHYGFPRNGNSALIKIGLLYQRHLEPG